MKLLSWNINGIRRIHADYKRRQPPGKPTSFAALLHNLDADIICLQELKSERAHIDPSYVDVDGYRSFFTFPIDKKAYSGVAIYVKHPFAPIRVETALCSPSYDSFKEDPMAIGGYPSSITQAEARKLDREGRILLLDFGAFILLGTYCPAGAESDDRVAFRRLWWKALNERCRNLVAAGRQVVLLGDLNVHCFPQDTVDADVDEYTPETLGPVGQCFRRLTADDGHLYGSEPRIFLDTARLLYPEREGMYTCWSVRLAARQGNYGSRIDFVLITEGLRPFLSIADTLPDIHGSDHCPVYATLSLTTGEGATLQVSTVADNVDPGISSAQQKLSAFFKKRSSPPPIAAAASPPSLKRKTSSIGGSGKKSQATLSAFLTGSSSKVVKEQEEVWQTFDPGAAEQASQTKQQFSSLFSKPVVPVCSGHQLPAKRQRTKKKGANMGREFWSCSVPLGQGQCDFWRWVR
ncbi:Endonuclease/exonuclease/phosphatase [Protomyces lactucae-debilis]|uniref:DNA-(apurinic or apyrimidinic site) endonuclease n=1 Tax=Protomyces lactucae-debilis TaxID=2754530 RepID=A0A1Y2EST3_PROLT|nr:Endonuclease/exonuclease/phosphatase [Protomyces lactucae-debilis]ORY74344.1 Endonuclease/exonuclease/phosphatase [Protomyces lactucae-debilis]